LFQLADRLGKTVAEIEETMPANEFIEWISYHRIVAAEKK
jgi:hypothetical protein